MNTKLPWKQRLDSHRTGDLKKLYLPKARRRRLRRVPKGDPFAVIHVHFKKHVPRCIGTGIKYVGCAVQELRRVFAEELPAAVLITRCAFSKASCRCPDGGARACSAKWVPDHERQVLHRFQILGRHLARRPCAPGDPRCAAIAHCTENPRPRKSARRFRCSRTRSQSCGAFWGRLTPTRLMLRKSWRSTEGSSRGHN